MTRRRLLLALLVLVLPGAGVSLLEPTGTVPGWLRGEHFFERRPAGYWRRQLRSTDPAAQAEALYRLRKGGARAVPVLVELLQQESADPEQRWRAAELLGAIGPEAADAVPALVAARRDADPHVRAVAVRSLGQLAPASAEAIPELVEALDSAERLPALAALANFGALAAPAVPRVRAILAKGGDAAVRWNAARTLGRIGPPARAAVPDLLAGLRDRDALVREHCAESLGQVGQADEVVLAGLVGVLGDPAARVRRDAVRSLGWLGPAARPAVRDIAGLLKDPDPAVRRAARQAWRQIDAKSAPESPVP
jgi:HEAT repeat protein